MVLGACLRVGIAAGTGIVGLLLVVDVHRLVFVVDDHHTFLVDGIAVVVVNPDIMHAGAYVDGGLGGTLETGIVIVLVDPDGSAVVELVVDQDSDSFGTGSHESDHCFVLIQVVDRARGAAAAQQDGCQCKENSFFNHSA